MSTVDNKNSKRLSICLNGLWDFAPGDGQLGEIPEHWESTKIVVPSPWNINSFAKPEEGEFLKEKYFLRGGDYDLFPQYPKEWEAAKSGWYQRSFFVPGDLKGIKLKLKFNAVHFYSEYYINGEKVASDTDGFLPFEFDVSGIVRYGEENTLVVGVKKLDLFTVKLEGSVESEKFEHPTGSFWGCHIAGIWQDVYLNACPADSIEDIFIQTDVANSLLSVQVEVSGCKKPASIEYILQKNKGTICNLLGRQDLPPGSGKSEFRYDYRGLEPEIKLWWPHSPELYVLIVNLVIDGCVVDSKDVRFGFRNFEIRGSKFVLNGTPINLRNDSWHYMGFAYQREQYARSWYRMAKDAHVNCIRLHAQVYPEFFLDIADEEGMLIIDESSIWASHCRMHYSERFVENSKKHLERLVKRDRNHPSVVIWSVENECIPAYRVHGDTAVKDEDELNERIFSIAKHVESLDPTRLTSADGGWDLGGRMDIVSLHYPAKHNTYTTDKPITIGEMGSMYYSTPDCICNVHGGKTYLTFDERLESIGREAFEYLKEHRKWAAQVCIFNLVWYGLYPLPFEERMLDYSEYSTPGVKPSKIGSYISTLNAGYDEKLPEYLPNPVFRWVQKAYLPERFFFEDSKSGYYYGSSAVKNLSVFNDSLEAREYAIDWKLVGVQGDIRSGSVTIAVPPAEFREVGIEFILPESMYIDRYDFIVDMRLNSSVLFSDRQEIKVYNKDALLEDLDTVGGIAFVQDTGDTGIDLNSGNVHFYKPHEVRDDCSIYVLFSEIASEIYNGLIEKGRRIIDISLCGPYFSRFSWQNPAEKAFFNINNDLLTNHLEEQDLYSWNNGISSFSLSDFTNANIKHIMVNGKGTPLISEILLNQTPVIISALNIKENLDKEPAALKLLINMILYQNSSIIRKINDVVLISRENSQLANFLKSMNVSFRLMDALDKSKIKELKELPVIIADGRYKLDYINELTSINTDKLMIIELEKENIPLYLKGYFDIVEAPLNQMIKANNNEIADGIHPGDMYGMEAGNEVLLVENPIYIRDKRKVTGLLKNSEINWIHWNFQGEDKKTIAVLRNEKETKQDIYGLVKTSVNGMQTYISQISLNTGSYKVRKLICTLLNNMDVEIKYKDIDMFDAILNEGIYDNGIRRFLVLGPVADYDIERMQPALNRNIDGLYWKLFENRSIEAKGEFLYGFYVFSPSDRTDLLLNPDLVGVQIDSCFDKKLYINRRLAAEGRNISLDALRLKAGWNEVIIHEKRDSEKNDKINILFTRKDNRPLDLVFSLDVPENAIIPDDMWSFGASHNSKDCSKAVQGKGIFWDSIESQSQGMYFSVDLGKEYTISKIQFNSKVVKLDHIQWNTPRSFRILTSMDGVNWEVLYTVQSENALTLIDGKFIANFGVHRGRYIKIQLDDVANKRFMISELKVYERICKN